MASQVSIIETIHFQPDEQNPVTMETRTSFRAFSEEQPYVRHLSIGEEWVPLDTGWIKEPSQVLIKNQEGRFSQRIPTPAQVLEMQARILELGWIHETSGEIVGPLLIRPQLHQRLEFGSIERVRIRCQKGKARITIMAFPK